MGAFGHHDDSEIKDSMNNTPMRILAFAALLTICAPAFAMALRTFVASYGNDANACTLLAPCRGFTAAVAQTNFGGEVIVLDSAGYGPVVITQTVSIIAPSGVFAGITVTLPSLDGVTVNGLGTVVTLRGLTISGQGASNHSGVHFAQGSKLTVEDCEISGFAIDGIHVDAPNSRVVVRNTVLRANTFTGFSTDGAINATLDGVRSDDNGINGVLATNGSRVTVTNSVLTNNGVAAVFANASGGTTTDVMVSHTTIAGSSMGFVVSAVAAGTASLVSDSNAINDVTSAAFFFTGLGGTENIYSSGTNTVSFNSPLLSGGSLSPIGQH